MEEAGEAAVVKVKVEQCERQEPELDTEGDVLVERVDILEDGVTICHEKMDNLSQELKTLLVGMDVLKGFIKGKFGVELVDRAAINGGLKQSHESENEDLSNCKDLKVVKAERKSKSKSKKSTSKANDGDVDEGSQESTSDPPPEPKKGKSGKKTKSKQPGIKLTIKREQSNPEELTSTVTTSPKKRGRPKKPDVKSEEC